MESGMTADVQDVVAPADNEPNDLDVILPDGGRVKVGGIPAKVNRLRTREFLAFMRVLTRGLGGAISEVELEGADQEQLKADLLAMVLQAMPLAADEFVDFLQVVVVPESTGDAARLAVEMQNPDPSDMLDVLGVLIEQEAPDLTVLVGKARAWITRIQTSLKQTTGPIPTPSRG